MQKILLKAVLNLFEGGDGGGAGAAAGGEGTATTGANNVSSDAGKKGDYANVLFGKQESAPEAEEPEANVVNAEPQQTQEDRTKAFKEFISKNKDLYDAEFQRVFNQRFKDHKELEAKVVEQQDVLDRMFARYNIDDGNLKSLGEAMDNDDAYYEQRADIEGMTIEQVKRLDQLQRQNNMLMRTEQQRMAEQEAQVAEARKNEQVQQWLTEAEGVTQAYPGFNLEAELTQPRFQAMLKAGVPMQDAYRAMHFDELQAQTAQATAAQTEKAVTSNIRAKGNRPLENGTTSQASFVVKDDVSRLTKADRAEIAKRALRGERISF